jgi:hypothetical protein
MSNDFYVVVSAHPSDFEGTLQAHGWFTDNEEADDYAECNGGRAIRCSSPAEWIEVCRHPVYGLLVFGRADSMAELEDNIYYRIKSCGGDPLSDGGRMVRVQSWHDLSDVTAQPRQEAEPEQDGSYARGWNDVAGIVCHGSADFDPDRYLQGVTEAIAEYRSKEEERSKVMTAHQSDMQSIIQAVERIKAAGIKIVAQAGAVDFDNGQGIKRVNGPEIFADCPF